MNLKAGYNNGEWKWKRQKIKAIREQKTKTKIMQRKTNWYPWNWNPNKWTADMFKEITEYPWNTESTKSADQKSILCPRRIVYRMLSLRQGLVKLLEYKRKYSFL